MARVTQGNRAKVFLAVAGLLALLPAARGQTVYDAVAQFDTVNNPSLSTPWTYGYLSATLTDSLSLLDLVGGGPVIFGWSSTAVLGGLPGIAINTSPTIPFDDGPTTTGPLEINMHPGPGNEFAILRFTAPVTSLYDITGDFNGNSESGTSTTVHILQNGSSIFSSTVNGFGTVTPFSFTSMALNSGATLDFVVGSNGNYFNDSTGFHLTIAAVPEPATGVLLALGLAGLLLLGRRHTSKSFRL